MKYKLWKERIFIFSTNQKEWFIVCTVHHKGNCWKPSKQWVNYELFHNMAVIITYIMCKTCKLYYAYWANPSNKNINHSGAYGLCVVIKRWHHRSLLFNNVIFRLFVSFLPSQKCNTLEIIGFPFGRIRTDKMLIFCHTHINMWYCKHKLLF